MEANGAQQIKQDILTATAADLVNKGTTSEVDYILSRDMKVLPMEVKSGTSGKMKSLRLFMQKKQLTRAIRCSMENFSRLENDGIDIIPLYAISNI